MKPFTTALLVGLGGILGYGYYQIYTLTKKVTSLRSELASTTLTFTANTNELAQNFLNLKLAVSDTITSTQQNLENVKFQVGGVAGTVGTLQKLSQIDPQILKKYSKVYFMNENYTPAHLTVLPTEYVFSTSRSEQFLSESWPFLKNLIDAARANGVALQVKSGYRSYAEQKSIKSNYSFVYGAGTANAFSAEQGYSEHQLGTTVDFTTPDLKGRLDGFDKTQSYQWLADNAYRYGFILSYPKGNGYYVYEPWHWRFVGIKLATYLHNMNLNFYSMDQRDIDAYLIATFDN